MIYSGKLALSFVSSLIAFWKLPNPIPKIGCLAPNSKVASQISQRMLLEEAIRPASGETEKSGPRKVQEV